VNLNHELQLLLAHIYFKRTGKSKAIIEDRENIKERVVTAAEFVTFL
jgi:hypothetical protein